MLPRTLPALLLLLSVGPRPCAAADPPRGPLDPLRYTELLRRQAARVRQWEAAEMLSAILGGSQLGPGDGWFHPGQSRYGWSWLAARFDADPRGKISRAQFR